jgi:two-component system NtrC family response regulator
MSKILIIDDDAAFSAGLAETVTDLGHEALTAATGEVGLKQIESDGITLVFLDLRMPGLDGLEVLKRLKENIEHREIPVIILTAFADSTNTIEAMRLGAFDHLSKPVARNDIKAVLERALARPSPMERSAPSPADESGEMIGSSPRMREVQKRIGLAASNRDATILILGETGTGKELVAHAIHRHSERAEKPFVPVNSAAIPADLLESELFGHVRGAFTGAVQPRMGRFKEADGGTLFLDEIGDMSLPMQAKILRVLEDRFVMPVGGSSAQKVDVRIVAATLRDLVNLVHEGKFREDLYYRLNVFPIALPPLRERGSDVLALAEHFLQQSQNPKRLSTVAAKTLLEYPWPGNVRELENLMRNLTLSVRGPVIGQDDLQLSQTSTFAESMEELLQLDYHSAIARLEKKLIQRALQASGGNRTEAARRLGINRQLLYSKLEEHGLDH